MKIDTVADAPDVARKFVFTGVSGNRRVQYDGTGKRNMGGYPNSLAVSYGYMLNGLDAY